MLSSRATLGTGKILLRNTVVNEKVNWAVDFHLFCFVSDGFLLQARFCFKGSMSAKVISVISASFSNAARQICGIKVCCQSLRHSTPSKQLIQIP